MHKPDNRPLRRWRGVLAGAAVIVLIAGGYGTWIVLSPSSPTTAKQAIGTEDPFAAAKQLAQSQDPKERDESLRVFMKLANEGDPRAARAIGEFYDPALYSPETSPLSAANADRAADWYRRAIDLGDEEAQARLDALRPDPVEVGDGETQEQEALGPDPVEVGNFDRQLAAAALAFRSPDRMRYGEEQIVELVLAPDSAGENPESLLTADLPGAVRTEQVQYAEKMRAVLSGPAFHVQPAGAQFRTILRDRPTKWTWTVVPEEFGEGKVLTLSVDAILFQGQRELDPIYVRTFTEHITVDVGLWGWLLARVKDFEGVHAAAVAIGGTLIGVLGYLLRLGRKKPEPKPVAIEIVLRDAAGSGIPSPDDASEWAASERSPQEGRDS